MNRPVLRLGAIIGAAAVSTLAVAPAFGAAATSKSSAQSLQLSLAGNSVIAQKLTASNNGTTETKSDSSTVPNLVGALPDNTALKAAVLPQQAGANNDGTSYACSGLASDGNGGPGVVTVGKESCDLKGSGAITLNLGQLTLGKALLTDKTAVSDAISQIPGLQDALTQAFGSLSDAVDQISTQLGKTPLGQIGLVGNLGVISAVCQANPDAATGDATLADSAIQLTLPDQKPMTLVNLPVHPNENQKVFGDTKGATTMVTDALTTYLTTFIQGQFAGTPLATLPSTVQTEVLNQVLDGLKPLTDALAQYVAEITLRKTTHGDNGRSIDVTALDLQVLPAVKEQVGSSLVSGQIGEVTCGPNTRATVDAPTKPGKVDSPKLPAVPTVVDSGMAGHADHTARNVLGATGALLLLAGTAGLLGYRRMLGK